ncbi:MAG: substrate-binding periplasmic protein [Rhodoferax sp.]
MRWLLLLWLLLGPPAAAQTVLRVGAFSGAEPYFEIVRTMYREVGLEPEFILLPAQRSLLMLEHGDLDADIGRAAGATAGYRHMLELHEPILQFQLLAVVRRDSRIEPIRSGAELRRYALGINRGAKLAEEYVKGIQAEPMLANSATQLLEMLVYARIEVAVVTSVALRPALAAFEDRVRVLDPPLAHASAVHVLHERWAAYRPRLEAALRQMRADGRLARLLAAAEKPAP